MPFDHAEFTRDVREIVAQVPEQRRSIPPRQADVDGLRELLDLTDGFSSNDQRARYILTSNWFRDHGAAAAGWADANGVYVPEQREATR